VVLRSRTGLWLSAAFLIALLALPASAGAQASTAAAEVQPIEQAVAELGRAKRSAGDAVARLSRRSSAALADCSSGGPGWRRIRAVKHAPQRNLYAASARRLLADMRLLIDQQQARIGAFGPAFERFVGRLQVAPVSNPVLREGIAAQARRLASYQDIAKVEASCRVFNKLTARVREFPTRTAEQIVRADYRAAPIGRAIERHVSNQLRAIDRRHGISWRDVITLEQAGDTMVELGSEPGYGIGFQYALSLR
jgi:hypothetical protein